LALVRVPAVGYWAAWFWIMLAPPSSLIPIPTEVGAERRMYVPLIGLVAIAALGGSTALQRLLSPEWRKKAAIAAAVVVVVAMGALTAARNVAYASGLAIWQDVLDRRPHARAHEHVSIHLRDAGRVDESIAHLRTAAAESPRARFALASALLERGELADSIAQFRLYVSANPAGPEIVRAREEFVVALSRAGDLDGALEQLRAITAASPSYARGRVMLAETLTQRKDFDGAIGEYREAIRLQPGNVVALAGLGGLLALRGERTEALTVLRRALELEPRALPPRRFIVRLLGEEKKYAEMEKEAALLATYAPTDPESHNLLGIALASQQRFAPASERFAEALRLDPSHDEARANRARVEAFLESQRR
jgi:Flp pilus assembly protein TadD